MNTRWLNSFVMMSLSALISPVLAVTIPSELPKPDASPGGSDKPVKVYILAGQSNMVGFGALAGARPAYPSVFLSSDPSVLPARMPIGASALLPHGVFVSADAKSSPGARMSIYEGAYKKGVDYASLKPLKEATIALGTVAAELPSVDGAHTVVMRAFIDVPLTGFHEIHAGFGESANAIVTLDGKEVYRQDTGGKLILTKVLLEKGTRYPISITFQKGGSSVFWMEHVDMKGQGDLTSLHEQGKYSWFFDDKGEWSVRNDVIYREVRVSKDELGRGGPLSATSNGRGIGPEVPFGFVMGTYHEEQVLLIESSMGNRALSFDFRPPSSGRTDPDNKWEGLEYRLMVEGVHKTLKNIEKVIPDYKGQGYEIVGFVWFQGHKDRGRTKAEYEKHLVNLIQDLRKEFNVPDMNAVVATVGFGGKDMIPEYEEILKAQLAVGDPKQHPEFAGKVASVDIRGFWRSQGESPTGTDYHYNHNAETYVLTGDALGRAMVELLGGKAEKLDGSSSRQVRHPDVERIYSAGILSRYSKTNKNPTPEQYGKMSQALRPIILDKLIPAFIEQAFGPDARRLKGLSLADLLKGKKPAKMGDGISSQLDTLISYYEAAGIFDYSWKTVDPEMDKASWLYASFDPPEKQASEKSNRYRDITYPAGMENWFKPGFDAAAAGWKTGHAPFGQKDGKRVGRRSNCYQPLCGCSATPATLWEKEVLLMQQTFDLPAAKAGYVYRFILGGAGCDRSGESFEVYVNGKLLTRVQGGFYRNAGVRGAYVYEDILPEFKGGKVTLSVLHFLRYTHHRNRDEYLGKPVLPNGHVSVRMEEAKVSPDVMHAASQ